MCCPSLPPVRPSKSLVRPSLLLLSSHAHSHFPSLALHQLRDNLTSLLVSERDLGVKVQGAERAHERIFGGNTVSSYTPLLIPPNSPTI